MRLSPSKAKKIIIIFIVYFCMAGFVCLTGFSGSIGCSSGGGGDDDDDLDCSDAANATNPACLLDCTLPENFLSPDCRDDYCGENPDDPACICLNPVDCDGDGLSGACDADDHNAENMGIKSTCDADGDGHIDVVCTGASVPLTVGSISCDNCIGTANPDQADADGDGFGDACDRLNCVDGDGDFVCDNVDNCPGAFNPDQTADIDGDGIGDVCDAPSVIKVAAGGWHNLALKSDGTVWAWGDNSSGQLGNGTMDDSATPVQVMKDEDDPLTGIVDIAAGSSHSVALDSDGKVWTWGKNSEGQLGDGRTPRVNKTRPDGISESMIGTGTVTAIAAGAGHTVALDNSGKVWTWGNNRSGQLGGGGEIGLSLNTPLDISAGFGGLEIKTVTAGTSNTAAITKEDGRVFVWGSDVYGQLGNGEPSTSASGSTTPVEVTALGTGVVDISIGNGHVVALKGDGTVWTWGFNVNGQLGNGEYGLDEDKSSPIEVELSNIQFVATGDQNTFAVDNNRNVFGWGHNWDSNLCIGSDDPGHVDIPTATLLLDIVVLEAGPGHTIALTSNRVVIACGSNRDGRLGSDILTEVGTPVPVPGL